jgi:hypothetical protein
MAPVGGMALAIASGISMAKRADLLLLSCSTEISYVKFFLIRLYP